VQPFRCYVLVDRDTPHHMGRRPLQGQLSAQRHCTIQPIAGVRPANDFQLRQGMSYLRKVTQASDRFAEPPGSARKGMGRKLPWRVTQGPAVL
jgi:hypothetical protein